MVKSKEDSFAYPNYAARGHALRKYFGLNYLKLGPIVRSAWPRPASPTAA